MTSNLICSIGLLHDPKIHYLFVQIYDCMPFEVKSRTAVQLNKDLMLEVHLW